MIYVTVSTGIGGGLILNNSIYRGSHGSAGEIGHMVISDNGYLCGCGNKGCVMSLASGPKIVRFLEEQIAAGRKTVLTGSTAGSSCISCEALHGAALSGDALALEVIHRAGDHLGIMFANLHQILNVDHYVIGGGVAKIGPLLFDRFQQKFYSMTKTIYPITFVPAKLGDDAGIIGAAMLFSDNL